MESRIHRMAQAALAGRINNHADAALLCRRLSTAPAEETPAILLEMFPALVRMDDDSRLVGNYPALEFWNIPQQKPDNRAMRKYDPLRNRLFIAGGNHKSADFEAVLTRGIDGYLRDIRASMKRFCNDPQRLAMLEELQACCLAILAWAEAHAIACEQRASTVTGPNRKKELEEMAAICRKVPKRPAETFREAVQSYFFVFLLFCDGLGRPDQYWYPYYQRDIDRGAITREQALALIEELFIRIFEKLGTRHEKSAFNHGVIGGYTEDGQCGHNACTDLILEAVTELPLWRPQFSYRYTKKTTPAQIYTVMEAHAKRPDLIMFLNDEVILENLRGIGIPFADAVKYSVSGCNETVLTGCSQMGSIEGHINLMYSLTRLLSSPDTAAISSFDEFYSALESYLCEDIETVLRYSRERDELESAASLPITSLFTGGCINTGTSVTKGGAKYNYCTWCLTGLINLSDSLSAIRQIVFEEKKCSADELCRALSQNWQGHERLRSYIVNQCPHFGNDDDRVDLLVNRITQSVQKIARKHTPFRGGQYLFGTLTGYEISHIVFGRSTPASPDGRLDGDPLAASVTAFPGADKKGATAYLKSAAKIDGSTLESSVVVNLTLDRKLIETRQSRQLLAEMFTTYFDMGGVQLQVNYLSAGQLIEAQKNPEHYHNLRVRVTGFSGFFTTFEKGLQDELISRALHGQ